MYRVWIVVASLFVFAQAMGATAQGGQRINQVIYYQHAKNAVLSNNTKGQYELTIAGIDNKTLVYEGDFKSADVLTTEKFFNNWGHYGFTDKPPYVAIIMISKGNSFSFTLKEPKFNVIKKTVTYLAEPLQEMDVNLIGLNWNAVVMLLQQIGSGS